MTTTEFQNLSVGSVFWLGSERHVVNQIENEYVPSGTYNDAGSEILIPRTCTIITADGRLAKVEDQVVAHFETERPK